MKLILFNPFSTVQYCTFAVIIHLIFASQGSDPFLSSLPLRIWAGF